MPRRAARYLEHGGVMVRVRQTVNKSGKGQRGQRKIDGKKEEKEEWCGAEEGESRSGRNKEAGLAIFSKAAFADSHSLILVRINFYPVPAGQQM